MIIHSFQEFVNILYKNITKIHDFYIYFFHYMSNLHTKNGEQACNYSILVHRASDNIDFFLPFNNFNNLRLRLFAF